MLDWSLEDFERWERSAAHFLSYIDPQEEKELLIDLAGLLGVTNNDEILHRPGDYFGAIDLRFSQAGPEITEEEEARAWTHLLATLIGRYFVVKHGGVWRHHPLKRSPYFCHFVLTEFPESASPELVISPANAAHTFVQAHPEGSLLVSIKKMEQDLRSGELNSGLVHY